MQRIAIAGATGFVGTGIVNQLLEQGYDVLALVRNHSEAHRDNERYQEHECDLFNPDSYAEKLRGCEAVINAIGIIREKKGSGATFERIHTQLNNVLLNAASARNVNRYVLISALGVRPNGVSRYQTSKWHAEEDIKQSDLKWAIFRPSFVLGEGAGFIDEIGPVAKAPLVPVFGRGDYRFEPVHRAVLAEAVVRVLESEDKTNRIYELRGEESHSYKEILRTIARASGREKVRFVHVPVWMVKTGVWLFGWLPFFPITMDQLNMLLEGNVGKGFNAVEEFDLDWIPLEEAVQSSLVSD